MNQMIGKNIILRPSSANGASVWFGTVELIDGDVVKLTNAIRIWSWEGAFTLSEVSKFGVDAKSKVATMVDAVTVKGWCELIICSEEATEKLIAASNKK